MAHPWDANLNDDNSQAIIDIVHRHTAPFEIFADTYRRIHRNPELSRQENETSEITAKHLCSLSFAVQTKIGGYGVVGVFRNGRGPTVLLRADMDALPVLERTGLQYASTKRAAWEDGKEYPVMHACGHDMNTAVLMATSTLLKSAKAHWKGTLICLFQPSEEAGGGAMVMV